MFFFFLVYLVNKTSECEIWGEIWNKNYSKYYLQAGYFNGVSVSKLQFAQILQKGWKYCLISLSTMNTMLTMTLALARRNKNIFTRNKIW